MTSYFQSMPQKAANYPGFGQSIQNTFLSEYSMRYNVGWVYQQFNWLEKSGWGCNVTLCHY